MLKIRVLVLAALVLGCSETFVDLTDYEGDDPGECSDGADNDRDGLFDCDDPDCAGSPGCPDPDARADGDGDGDGDVEMSDSPDGDERDISEVEPDDVGNPDAEETGEDAAEDMPGDEATDAPDATPACTEFHEFSETTDAVAVNQTCACTSRGVASWVTFDFYHSSPGSLYVPDFRTTGCWTPDTCFAWLLRSHTLPATETETVSINVALWVYIPSSTTWIRPERAVWMGWVSAQGPEVSAGEELPNRFVSYTGPSMMSWLPREPDRWYHIEQRVTIEYIRTFYPGPPESPYEAYPVHLITLVDGHLLGNWDQTWSIGGDFTQPYFRLSGPAWYDDICITISVSTP